MITIRDNQVPVVTDYEMFGIKFLIPLIPPPTAYKLEKL